MNGFTKKPPASAPAPASGETSLKEFLKRGLAAQHAVDSLVEASTTSAAVKKSAKHVTEQETWDAVSLLQRLGLKVDYDRVMIVRAVLKKHWLAGWQSAGGKAGVRKDEKS